MNKLKSIKNWLLLWTISMITYIVITDKLSFLPLVQNLAIAVTAYIGANTLQKKIFADKETKLYDTKTKLYQERGKQSADSKSKP